MTSRAFKKGNIINEIKIAHDGEKALDFLGIFPSIYKSGHTIKVILACIK